MEMVPSPFHGIFSSFVQSGEEELGVLKSEAKVPAMSKTTTKPAGGSARTAGVGQVALDIFEYDDYYIIKAPIAGVRLADINIDIIEDVLTIRGTRRQNDNIPEEQYYLKECFWGEFQRSVTLPCSIDARQVKATFNKDSILKVIVPKEKKIKIIRISD